MPRAAWLQSGMRSSSEEAYLYIGSYFTHEVMRFDPATGNFIDIFATVPLAGDAGKVGDVGFGPDGNLCVAAGSETAPQSDIWRFDGTTGAPLGPFIPAGDLHPLFANIFAFGPDGNLYVPSG